MPAASDLPFMFVKEKLLIVTLLSAHTETRTLPVIMNEDRATLDTSAILREHTPEEVNMVVSPSPNIDGPGSEIDVGRQCVSSGWNVGHGVGVTDSPIKCGGE